MSSADDHQKRVIIVKRHHGDHDDDHGGQWKIAYADFVTAMMAFFLVMWLLSSTTETQREGIAQFFTASSILDLPSGNGALDGGQSVLTAGDSRQDTMTQASDGGSGQDGQGGTTDSDGAAAAQPAPDAAPRDPIERQRFDAMKAELERQMNSDALKEFAQNMQIEMTPEGLRLQIFDRDGAAMFQPGGSEPTPRLVRILEVIGSVLATVPNEVVVAGHTDGQPFQRGTYGNWELSADRANSTRRLLERDGVPARRMFRVEGKASVEPLLAAAPNDPRNRRIAITVLRSDVVAEARAAAARRAPDQPRR
jgi:chemotaxis protein MotB